MDSTSKMILYVTITICIYYLLKRVLELKEKSLEMDREFIKVDKDNRKEFTEEEKREIMQESNKVMNDLENTIEHNLFGINEQDVKSGKYE